MLHSCNNIWARKVSKVVLDQLSSEVSAKSKPYNAMVAERISKNWERVGSLLNAHEVLCGCVDSPNMMLLHELDERYSFADDIFSGSLEESLVDMDTNLEKNERILVEILESISISPNPKQENS